jgi:hypothetical protein
VSSLYGFEAEAPGKRKAFTRVHNLWRASEAVGALALSPRLAGAAATLLGVPSVRLYQVTCSPCVARDCLSLGAPRFVSPRPGLSMAMILPSSAVFAQALLFSQASLSVAQRELVCAAVALAGLWVFQAAWGR